MYIHVYRCIHVPQKTKHIVQLANYENCGKTCGKITFS